MDNFHFESVCNIIPQNYFLRLVTVTVTVVIGFGGCQNAVLISAAEMLYVNIIKDQWYISIKTVFHCNNYVAIVILIGKSE